MVAQRFLITICVIFFKTYQRRHRLNTTSDVEGLKSNSDVTECQRFKKLPVNDSSNSADVILFHFVRDSVIVHDLKFLSCKSCQTSF